MQPNTRIILRRIAEQEGITEREVLDEMQKAIDAGYNDPDPAVRARWAAMPFKGKPTIEEFILYMAGEVHKAQRQ